MGSKLSRSVHGHKAGAAPPRELTSLQSCRQDICNGEQTKLEVNSPPTQTLACDSHECELTPTQHTNTTHINQRPQQSTDSRSASSLRDAQDTQGGLEKDLQPSSSLEHVNKSLGDEEQGQHLPIMMEPPPPPPPPPPKKEIQSKGLSDCLMCCTPCDAPGKVPAKEVVPCNSCKHVVCAPCVKNMFTEACRDFSRMPPRCCTQIPLYHVRPLMTPAEIAEFKAKYEEWSTPDPFYCPVPRCSAFIPTYLLPQARKKRRVDSGVGTPTQTTVPCPQCNIEICTSCRSLAHASGSCTPLDFGVDKQTADLLREWGYKRCPKCGHGVKRMYGCSHMECRCGAHFCWGCLAGRGECDGCDDDEDENHSDYEEPDEELDDAEQEDEQPAAPEVPSPNLAHVFPHILQSEEPEESLTTPVQPEDNGVATTALPTRVRNLDGGSRAFWEGQDMHFGDEPTDDFQDRAWDCTHQYAISKITLKQALTNDVSAHHMDCMKCWATIHPEIRMPNSIHSNTTKYTTAVSRASAPDHERKRSGRRLSVVHDQQSLPNDDVVKLMRKTRSVANFRARLMAPLAPAEEEGVGYARDLYGGILATTDMDKTNNRISYDSHWEDVELATGDEDAEVKDNATFSFAYVCHWCGILVCQKCKEDLKAEHDSTGDRKRGGRDR